MAYGIWKGPGGRGNAPTTGDFFAAANWSTGAVPDQTIDALFGAGTYTVTIDHAAAAVRSFDIASGVTLDVIGGNSASLIAQTNSVSNGTVRIAGGVVALTGEFVNFGAIYGEGYEGYIAQVGSGGSLANEGLISTAANVGVPALALTTTLRNDEGGVVSTQAGGAIYLLATSTNAGLIEAVNGGLVSTTGFNRTGTVTNLDGNVLSGGHWTATGAGATIWLANTTISTLASGAVVTLDGAGSNVRIDDGSGDPFYLEQTLDTVWESATLAVLGGRDYATTENLAVDGTLQLGGGTFSAGELRGGTSATIAGFGTIAALATLDGTVRADRNPADRKDTLEFTTYTDFNGPVTGRGTLELSGGRDTFTTGKVTVATLLLDGADVQVDKSFRYGGHLIMTTGTIDLTDRSLTLTGDTTMSGGTIEGAPRGKLELSGDLHVQGGDAVLDVRSISLGGAATVDHGSLTVNGTVTGAGGFTVGAKGTLILGEASHFTAASPLVTLDGAGATVRFDNLDSPLARVDDFDGRDRIDFSTFGTAGTKLTWRADEDGSGGTLRLTNATQTAAVHLEENHVKGDFKFASDGIGGTVVTAKVTTAATAAFGTAGASAFGEDAAAAGHHETGFHAFAAAHDWHGITALV